MKVSAILREDVVGCARKRILPVLAALLTLLAACGPGEVPIETPEPSLEATSALSAETPSPTETPTATPAPAGMTLSVGWEGDLVDCLNFAVCRRGKRAWDLLYDSLVGWGAVGDEGIAPRLAESWDVAPGSMKITFHLRDLEGSTFHDGTPFTAEDVAWSLNYHAGNGALAWLLGTAVGQGFGAQAVDDETVELHLIEPINSDVLLSYLTNVYVLPPQIWSAYDETTIESFRNLDAIGSGPYLLADWAPGEHMIFEAHEASPLGRPPFDRVVVRFFPEPDSMSRALLAGEIGMLSSLRPIEIASLVDSPDIELYEKAPINGYWLVFNSWEDGGQAAAIGDRAVRQAIAHAIDQRTLIESVEAGAGVSPDSLWDGGERYDQWAHPELTAYSFNLDRAAELLEAAGYTDEDGDGVREAEGRPQASLELRLSYSTDLPEPERLAQMIADWLREIGVGVELEGLSSTRLSENMLSADYDMAIDRIDLGPDPDLSLYHMTSWALDAGVNGSGYGNIELDSMYLAQHYAADKAERSMYLWSAQQILHDDLPWIPLLYSEAYDVVRGDRFDLTITDTYDEIWGWYGIWGIQAAE
jgi:peptide/nickel transport system substrate-binding protein